MIIDNLYVISVAGAPPEADTPLIVDPDAVLAGSIALQGFEPVSWRHPQKVEGCGGIDLQQLSMRDPLYVGRKATAVLATKQPLGFLVRKILDHLSAGLAQDQSNSRIRN